MAENTSHPIPSPEESRELNASTVHDARVNEPPTLFKLDPGVGIWAIIVFFLLLLILKKFAWGPIISSIEDREKNIRDSLDKAKQAQNESKRIANEQNAIINQAKSEASSIVQQAKNASEELANKIKNEALEEKSRIIESGVKQVESTRAATMSTLKKDTAGLAINIAEILLRETIDSKKHRKYVEKAIEELDINK